MKLLQGYEGNVKIKSSDIIDVRVIENCIELEIENGDEYKVVFEPNVFLKTIENTYMRIMTWLNGDEDLVLRRKIRKVRKH